jgi:hypothetical protein
MYFARDISNTNALELTGNPECGFKVAPSMRNQALTFSHGFAIEAVKVGRASNFLISFFIFESRNEASAKRMVQN